ncbi:MAG: hypothetical protein NXI20_12315 [bacterium]|nr:hypothetical protein [bacterium]
MRLLTFLLLSVVVFSCSDECETTISYYANVPIYGNIDSVRNAVEIQDPREIDTPERLYFKDNFIFIVESGHGIHVIDNANQASPVTVKFIQIPGNHDVAIQGNSLYADSYIDLLVFDVSNIDNITLTTRVENVFEYYGDFFMASSLNAEEIVTGWEEQFIEESQIEDCGNGGWNWGGQDDVVTLEASRGGVSGSGAGTGGSMARFTINNGHLYTVDYWSIRHFDLTDPTKPAPSDPLGIGWDIETVFPYEDNLFIGSRTGMHIYGLEDPSNPQFMSIFEHANACDPVVVENDIAYVTLRDGNECETFTNQLDILDVSDVTNPQLIMSYNMQNPHGLGIKDGCLYICEGEYGLKYYDAADPRDIELKKHYEDLHALDVIPLDNRLLMIGNDGFYQYEGYCTDQINFLSVIDF